MISAGQPFRRWVWLVLAACWFATMAWRPLLEPDEGRYAEIPREMWVSGDWVTPRLNGIRYFEKPPLQYWATAVAYSLFGSSEGTARFWAIALSFLGLPLAYGFARAMYGESAAGIAALLVLAANPFYSLVGQLNLLDGAFSFLLVAAVFAFLRSRRATGATEERRWMLLTWLVLAGAVLSKGIVVFVLVGATLVVYSLTTRDLRVWRRWHWLLGLPVLIVVTVPWFWIVSRRNPEFLEFFFVHEHFARFLTTVHERTAPWWYFLAIVLLAMLPWARDLWPSLRSAWHAGAPSDRALVDRFLVVWCGVVLLFFSTSQSKLPPYIMPMMVPLAVLLARRVASDARSVRQASWIVAVLMTLVALGMVVLVIRKRVDVPVLLWTGAAVALVASALGILALRRAPTAGIGSGHFVAFACTSLVGWQALLVGYSAFPPPRTAKPLVAAVRQAVRKETALYSVGQYRQTIPPYLQRTLTVSAYRGEFELDFAHEDVPYLPTLDAFIAEWQQCIDAIAFVSPSVYAQLVARRVPLHELASDGRTVVVSRQFADAHVPANP